jgi:gliding motility-associated-like protein
MKLNISISFLVLISFFNAAFAQSPTITPQPGPITLQLNANGIYTVQLNDVATVTSGDGSVPVVSFTPQSFNCKTLGQQTVTVQASDAPSATSTNPSAASFEHPYGLVFDPSGNLFVAEDGDRVRKIDPAGQVSLYAGSDPPGFMNGPGATAKFTNVVGIVADKAGNLYVIDGGTMIRKIDINDNVTTFVGSSRPGLFTALSGITIDVAGNLYVTEGGNNTIKKISPAGLVTTIAGNGVSGYIDAKGTAASFNTPEGICADAAGNLYVADVNNHRIRKIAPDGQVTTLAGNSSFTTIDGTGTAASFIGPSSITIDSNGNLYTGDDYVRKITPDGVVTTIAGNKTSGSVDGYGASASFYYITGICIDAYGFIYAADFGNNKIRKVFPNGYVATIAGDGTYDDSDGNIGVLQSTDYPVQSVIPVTIVDPTGNCTVPPPIIVTPPVVTTAIIIANTFTPNGDGINDLWNIPALAAYPDCTVSIYNRYGKLVFQSIGYGNSWDGKNNGKPLPVGPYYYIIKFNTSKQPLSGSVTILK